MSNAKKTTEIRVPISETYRLPSNGKLYSGKYGTDIKLRAMTTLDEKARLSANGLKSLVALLNNCVTEPDDFDANELKMFDIEYLLYKLRTVTYGSKYNISTYCVNCGKYVDMVVDLDDIQVTELPDDFEEFFTIGELPVSKDKLTCKILSVNDLLEIERESERISNKFKDYVGSPSYILSYCAIITKINGDEYPDFKKQQYIENLHAMDLRYLDIMYDRIVDGYGLNTNNIEHECPICGKQLTFSMPITEEFFRPDFNF